MLVLRGLGLLGLSLLLACSTSPERDPVASDVAPIQGGVLAPKDNFSVAIRAEGGLCTGTLIAPNLVLTARHCVEVRPSERPDGCEDEELVEPSGLSVTPAAKALSASKSEFIEVSKILVGPKTNNCDPDIALIELAKPMPEGKATVVAPAVDTASLARTHFTTKVTAIGYGLDDTGSPGTRRKREDIDVLCVIDDTAFECNGYEEYIQSFEIIAGKGACQGDSGGGLYDQTSIDEGKPVVVATVSRGPKDEQGLCLEGAYVRVDKFADFIKEAAVGAAERGGYDPPVWTGVKPKPKTKPPVEEPPAPENEDEGEEAAPAAAATPTVTTIRKTTTCAAAPADAGSGATSALVFGLAGLVLARRRREKR